MATLLKVIGTIIIVSSILGGITSGSLLNFVLVIVSGLAGAILYFVLASVLETQDDIIQMIKDHKHIEKDKV